MDNVNLAITKDDVDDAFKRQRAINESLKQIAKKSHDQKKKANNRAKKSRKLNRKK